MLGVLAVGERGLSETELLEMQWAREERRLAALAALADAWVAFVNERCPSAVAEVVREPGVVKVYGVAVQDEFTFDVTVNLQA